MWVSSTHWPGLSSLFFILLLSDFIMSLVQFISLWSVSLAVISILHHQLPMRYLKVGAQHVLHIHTRTHARNMSKIELISLQTRPTSELPFYCEGYQLFSFTFKCLSFPTFQTFFPPSQPINIGLFAIAILNSQWNTPYLHLGAFAFIDCAHIWDVCLPLTRLLESQFKRSLWFYLLYPQCLIQCFAQS